MHENFIVEKKSANTCRVEGTCSVVQVVQPSACVPWYSRFSQSPKVFVHCNRISTWGVPGGFVAGSKPLQWRVLDMEDGGRRTRK